MKKNLFNLILDSLIGKYKNIINTVIVNTDSMYFLINRRLIDVEIYPCICSRKLFTFCNKYSTHKCI